MERGPGTGRDYDDPQGLARSVVRAIPPSLEVANDVASDLGATRKWVFRLFDGATIETVLMAYEDASRCASRPRPDAPWAARSARPTGGLHPTPQRGEVLEQVMFAARAAAPRRLSNVVFMGMGEPLANYS